MARDGFLLEGETGGIHSVVILLFVVLTMDSVLRKLFSGDFDFRKTETNSVLAFCPRGGGVWGGIRAGFLNFFQRAGCG